MHSLVNVLHSSSFHTRKVFSAMYSTTGPLLKAKGVLLLHRSTCPRHAALMNVRLKDHLQLSLPSSLLPVQAFPNPNPSPHHTTPHCHSDSRSATGTHTGAAINNTHMYSAQRHGPCSCSVSLSSSPSPSPSPWDRTGCTEERSSIDCRGERGSGWVETLTDPTHPPTAGVVGVSL